MIFLLDNYDSFTYNLYQMLQVIGEEIKVARNDEVTSREVAAMNPTCVMLSPGPGRPENSGVMPELIAELVGKVPLFGVCLGMQGLAAYFGGKIERAHELVHGKSCLITHDGDGIFADLPEKIEVMRYHSLALKCCPSEIIVTASSDDGEVMAIRHRQLPVEAVQFHPESFATQSGDKMLRNFLNQHGS